MLRITTAEARPGMTLALPVFHPQHPGLVLLKPGATLDAVILRSLEEVGIRRLFVTYPPLGYLIKYVNVGIMTEHAKVTQRLGECFDAVRTKVHANLDFASYAGAVRTLIDKVVMDPEAAVFLHDIADGRQALLAHCSNVCMLSLLMGLKLDGYLVTQRKQISPKRAQNIENLGVGALLHDIGLLKLPAEIRQHAVGAPPPDAPSGAADPSDAAHDELYRSHVTIGYEMVRGKIAPTAAAAVLHHHQRMDGSGFPLKKRLDGSKAALVGPQIHVFARIVAVADIFDRLRFPWGAQESNSDEQAQPNVRTLGAMLRLARAGVIDRVIFKALLAVVPAYPPGTVVLLSDGTTGAVSGWNPMDPCRPTVTPIPASTADLDRDKPVGDPIDLMKRRDLRIVMADGQVVEHDNFEPGEPGEFDIRVPMDGYYVATLVGGEAAAAA